jgi:hypothetical protein
MSKKALLVYYYIFCLNKYARSPVKEDTIIIEEKEKITVSDKDFDDLPEDIKTKVHKIYKLRNTFEYRLYKYIIRNKSFPLKGLLYEWALANWDSLSSYPYFPISKSTWNIRDQNYITELKKLQSGLKTNTFIIKELLNSYNYGNLNEEILDNYRDTIIKINRNC